MKRTSTFSVALTVLMLLGLSGFIYGQQPPPPAPRPTPKPIAVPAVTGEIKISPLPGSKPDTAVYTGAQQRRVDSFDKVWKTLNDNYFDRTFNGLNWENVRKEYRPLAVASKSDPEFHRIVQEMIGKLGKSHFVVIPPEYLRTIASARKESKTKEEELRTGKKAAGTDLDADDSGEDEDIFEDDNARYGVGIDLRLINDQFVITEVQPQSGGSLAGLKPGFVIEKINGVSLADMLRQLALKGGGGNNFRKHLAMEVVAWFLNGDRDTSVFLTCLDGNDKPVAFKVPRLALGGKMISLGGNFPEQFFQFQATSLNDDVGYVKFNFFLLPVVAKFCDALTQFASKKALIIDLRGNTGGLIATVIGLSGMLTDRSITLGTSVYRRFKEPLVAQSKAKNFTGKVVFLVDGGSASASEMFTAGLKENGRALVVGEHTSGEALPSISIRLATGAVFMYPMANFLTAAGKSLEGTGVEPDYAVSLDRSSLLRGVDLQLEKALAVARSDEAFKWGSPDNLIILGDANGPPPPPKPIPRTSGSGSGSQPPPPIRLTVPNGGTGGLSALPAAASGADIKDPKAVQLIEAFTAKIGGRDAFKKLVSYKAEGKATIVYNGSETDVDIASYRQFPGKLTIDLSSPAIGHVREVYGNGKGLVQAEYGLERELPYALDISASEVLGPLFRLQDDSYWRSFKFEGIYPIAGRRMNVITAKNKLGMPIGLAFDAETGLLNTYTPLGSIISFGDYRPVNGIILPFLINSERSMKVQLDTIVLDPVIDPSVFERKEMCFDKPIK